MISTNDTTIDDKEVERFSRIAAEWWDPTGKFRPLHKFNPIRLAYIKEKICLAFDRDSKSEAPFKDLRILDIGCGGGLLSEPMAKLGANVVGADASEVNIEVAKLHASQNKLTIDYRQTTAENLASKNELFDIILNMEVIEHVANVDLFMQASCQMVKPGGLMFIATLNRTLKAWALAIIGAEYILNWLPKGTHHYDKFLRPQEIERLLIKNGLSTIDELGIVYNLLQDSWSRSKDMSTNYILLARRLA